MVNKFIGHKRCLNKILVLQKLGLTKIMIQWHKCWKVLQSGLRIQSCITGEKESTKEMMRQNLAIL